MTESDTPDIYDSESENSVFINNNHIDEPLMSNIQDIKGKESSSSLPGVCKMSRKYEKIETFAAI